MTENQPLAPLTTFRIGGPARYFIATCDPREISEAKAFADEKRLPWYVLSGGSNVLVSDAGFPGLVVHIEGGSLHMRQNIIEADAGILLSSVVERAASEGYSGLERLAGIPGSFGGAIRGNAGAFGAEIKDTVKRVKVLDTETGLVSVWEKERCEFAYRESAFKRTKRLVVLGATLELGPPAAPSDLASIMRETKAKREAKHPQDALCAGSFFMNPTVTDKRLLEEFERDSREPSRNGRLPAGWLIEHVGLRGKKIGGAQMSPLHPNYLVNTGDATASDVVMLASLVKTRVRDELGVRLREEAQYVGF